MHHRGISPPCQSNAPPKRQPTACRTARSARVDDTVPNKQTPGRYADWAAERGFDKQDQPCGDLEPYTREKRR